MSSSTSPAPRIWGDFNGLHRGHIPLDTKGSVHDLQRLGSAATEGAVVIVYDDDCESDAILERHGDTWCARIRGEIRDAEGRPIRFRSPAPGRPRR